jgi:hypothetical protein
MIATLVEALRDQGSAEESILYRQELILHRKIEKPQRK